MKESPQRNGLVSSTEEPQDIRLFTGIFPHYVVLFIGLFLQDIVLFIGLFLLFIGLFLQDIVLIWRRVPCETDWCQALASWRK